MVRIGKPLGQVAEEILKSVCERSRLNAFSWQEYRAARSRVESPTLSIIDPIGYSDEGYIHVVTGYSDKCVSSGSIRHVLTMLFDGSAQLVQIVTERSAELVVERFVEVMAGLPLAEIHSYRFKDDEWSRIIAALDWLQNSPIYICSPLDVSQVAFLSSLDDSRSLRSLTWVDALGQSPWRMAWDAHPDGERHFLTTILRSCRGTGSTFLLSSPRSVREASLQAVSHVTSLPGNGILEEVAHVIEAIELHLPDDLGFASQSFVESTVVKNKLHHQKPVIRFGWDEATQHLREVQRISI